MLVSRRVVAVRHGSLDGLGSLARLASDGLLDTTQRLLVALFGISGLGVILGLLGVGVDAVGAGVADELGEVLDGAGAVVVDRGRVLLAGGEELDGGEALDLLRDVVGRRVDFGDDDLLGELGVVEVEAGELLVLGCEAETACQRRS